MSKSSTLIKMKRRLANSSTTDEVIGAIVLADGEPFYDIKNRKFYIGDGETPISDLPSIGADSLYAQYIGTADSHPAIGGVNQPVYVNSNGKVKAATAYSAASVASATEATNATNVTGKVGNQNITDIFKYVDST